MLGFHFHALLSTNIILRITMLLSFSSFTFLIKINFYGLLCYPLRIVHILCLLKSVGFEKMYFQAEISSCLMTNVYIEIYRDLIFFSWPFLFHHLLCYNPVGGWGCHEKCKVCINHVTGQCIITEHFLFFSLALLRLN